MILGEKVKARKRQTKSSKLSDLKEESGVKRDLPRSLFPKRVYGRELHEEQTSETTLVSTPLSADHMWCEKNTLVWGKKLLRP